MEIYSYSRIKTFENCPLTYRYRYIDRIKVDTEGIEAFMGSRVHKSLEKLYRDDIWDKESSLKSLLDFYHSNWEKNWHDSVIIVRKEYSKEHYREIGRRSLEQYYKRYFPFDQAEICALEKRIEIPLDDFRFVGYIDRLSRRVDGTYEVHDYKTSSRLPLQRDIDEDWQLAIYQLGLQDIWDDVNDVDLIWHYLAFDKEFRSKRSPEILESLKREIISKINDIEDTIDFEPKESMLCRWCAYQNLCSAGKRSF